MKNNSKEEPMIQIVDMLGNEVDKNPLRYTIDKVATILMRQYGPNVISESVFFHIGCLYMSSRFLQSKNVPSIITDAELISILNETLTNIIRQNSDAIGDAVTIEEV